MSGPSERNTRSIFKLNQFEFRVFFFLTGCLTNVEEFSLPYYFTHNWRENNWIHTFP